MNMQCLGEVATAVFMVMWWALVEDLHECAVKLETTIHRFWALCGTTENGHKFNSNCEETID